MHHCLPTSAYPRIVTHCDTILTCRCSNESRHHAGSLLLQAVVDVLDALLELWAVWRCLGVVVICSCAPRKLDDGELRHFHTTHLNHRAEHLTPQTALILPDTFTLSHYLCQAQTPGVTSHPSLQTETLLYYFDTIQLLSYHPMQYHNTLKYTTTWSHHNNFTIIQ